MYGLVKNAGVFTGGPLIETDIGELQWLFDVNVYGVYRVTQSFAPLIIESKGRIINISSISGVLDWPMGGPYSMSKHAIEAYNDTLALEMDRFGVGVSVIEPGNYKSDISMAAEAALHALFDDNPKPRYMVVPNQKEAEWTIGELVKELVEWNEHQPYSYSREQLIDMIDAAMAASD